MKVTRDDSTMRVRGRQANLLEYSNPKIQNTLIIPADADQSRWCIRYAGFVLVFTKGDNFAIL